MSDLTPSQIFEFYHTRLTEVLKKHNPEGLGTITALLKQFPGKEHVVYSQICKKFSVTPVARPTSNDFEDGRVKPLKVDTRVSDWLNKMLFERYAKKPQFQAMSWEDFISISTKGALIELGVLPNDATLLLPAILKERGNDGKSDKPLPEEKADFEVGENCYTVVLASGKDGEKWLNARITNVNEDDGSYDIFVYNAKAFNVASEAVNVPRKMLKKRTEKVQVAVPDLKRKSTKRPQFQQGDRVRVFGLRSHTTYNGLFGTVLLYVASERRYQVRLDTNDVIAIKQRNVTAAGDDDKKPLKQSGKKKSKHGAAVKDDETMLSELMTKLMQDNPTTDPGKLGEFAAGYLLAKKKMAKEN
jgi:hypothetical protein